VNDLPAAFALLPNTMASALASSRCVSSVAGLSAISRPVTRPATTLAPRAALPSFKRVAQTAGVSVATLAVAFSAHAANVQMGGAGGVLAFIPEELSVSAGETVTFTNKAGFPHNIVFDEDAVPAGVNADAISHPVRVLLPLSSFFFLSGTPLCLVSLLQ
jgi:plastocyanin